MMQLMAPPTAKRSIRDIIGVSRAPRIRFEDFAEWAMKQNLDSCLL